MADSISLRDLADELAETLGVSKASAYDAASELFAKISKTALSGGRVSVHGFGSFNLKERKARTGRNPQTGASIKISASKSVGFKPGSALKKKAGKK